jgi:hypothetical protein
MRMAERQRQFSRVLGRFLVYDDRVDVLAITGSKQRIDHSMSPDEARALWADLCQCGWHRASEGRDYPASDVASKIAFNRLRQSTLIGSSLVALAPFLMS